MLKKRKQRNLHHEAISLIDERDDFINSLGYRRQNREYYQETIGGFFKGFALGSLFTGGSSGLLSLGANYGTKKIIEKLNERDQNKVEEYNNDIDNYKSKLIQSESKFKWFLYLNPSTIIILEFF
jgi:hypothetical protein